jgi:hypothetical protein
MEYETRADFHLFTRRGKKISGGVQTAPLSEVQQGLGVWVIYLFINFSRQQKYKHIQTGRFRNANTA